MAIPEEENEEGCPENLELRVGKERKEKEERCKLQNHRISESETWALYWAISCLKGPILLGFSP